MKPEEIAEKMSVDPNIIYLNHAAFSPLPKRTTSLFHSLINDKAQYGTLGEHFQDQIWKEEYLPCIKENTSKMIGGHPEGLGFIRSTLQGIHQVVEGLPWKNGENIVITDMEFNTNSFVHQVVAKKNNLDLRVVENKNGI